MAARPVITNSKRMKKRDCSVQQGNKFINMVSIAHDGFVPHPYPNELQYLINVCALFIVESVANV